MKAQAVCATLCLLTLTGCTHVGIFEPFREVSCLDRATVSLKDAISAAEASGGRALDADFREDEELGCIRGNAGFFDVTLLTAGKISTVAVNADSRVVASREAQGVMDALFGGGTRFQGSAADMARIAPRLSLDMIQAIDIAERQGAKVMSAWIDEKDGKPGYVVKLVAGGKVRELWVDGV